MNIKNHPITKNLNARMAKWDKENPTPALGERIAKWREIYEEERLAYLDEVEKRLKEKM